VGFEAGAAWMGGRLMPVGEAALPVTDWGLIHSDIVYDVVPVWEGAFLRLDRHLDRFLASVAAARMSIPEDRAAIRRILHAIAAKSGLASAYVAMVASRGRPADPRNRDPRFCVNHFFAWCVPYVHVFGAEGAARGIALHIARDVRRIPPDSVNPRAKNYHWGDFTQGLFAAKDAGLDNVLLLDHAGAVTEGPGFNVFAVIGGCVVTPEAGCLEGITRETALEVAAAAGIVAEVRRLPEAELMEADEVFVTSSGGGPVAVVRIDDRVFSNGAEGEVTRRIREGYWARMRAGPDREPVDPGALAALEAG